MAIRVEDGIGRLFGKIQNYSWGGDTFIPVFIQIKPEPGVTYAEYWLGAHETAPSRMLRDDGTTEALDEIIKEQPQKTLGPRIARQYGRLPFLLKVMDVREMLSIQVHPTKAEAEKGFARENEMGIPLDSPARNYKDENHKPELEVALSDFWLLYGFRPDNQLRAVLQQIPEFHPLQPLFASEGYFGLYKYVMEMPQELVNIFLHALVERALRKYASGELDESSPDYWVAKTREGKQGGDYDRGVFSIYFFNLVKLKRGQATFQDAGMPHAYLHGQAIEIMANSDNVIRGGLTPKHVDVAELLKLIMCQGVNPEVIEGRQHDNPHEAFYESPSHDFCLSQIKLSRGDLYKNTTYSIEILLTLHGETMLDGPGGPLLVKKGESVVVFAGKNYSIKALSDKSVVFRAFIPHAQGTTAS